MDKAKKDPLDRLWELEGQLVGYGNGMYEPRYEELEGLTDEIRAAYMKLPVDKDGVPIRVGDTMTRTTCDRFKAFALGDGVVFLECGYENGRYTVEAYEANMLGHAERTIEDVLAEYYDKRGWDEADNSALEADAITAKYADEIRELRGDAE